jgi:hypothetical protein
MMDAVRQQSTIKIKSKGNTSTINNFPFIPCQAYDAVSRCQYKQKEMKLLVSIAMTSSTCNDITVKLLGISIGKHTCHYNTRADKGSMTEVPANNGH